MILCLHFAGDGGTIFINFSHVKAFVQTDKGTMICMDSGAETFTVVESAAVIFEMLKGAGK